MTGAVASEAARSAFRQLERAAEQLVACALFAADGHPDLSAAHAATARGALRELDSDLAACAGATARARLARARGLDWRATLVAFAACDAAAGAGAR